jgi:hypothetical protein
MVLRVCRDILGDRHDVPVPETASVTSTESGPGQAP